MDNLRVVGGMIIAALVLTIFPVIVACLLLQKYILRVVL